MFVMFTVPWEFPRSHRSPVTILVPSMGLEVSPNSSPWRDFPALVVGLLREMSCSRSKPLLYGNGGRAPGVAILYPISRVNSGMGNLSFPHLAPNVCNPRPTYIRVNIPCTFYFSHFHFFFSSFTRSIHKDLKKWRLILLLRAATRVSNMRGNLSAISSRPKTLRSIPHTQPTNQPRRPCCCMFHRPCII